MCRRSSAVAGPRGRLFGVLVVLSWFTLTGCNTRPHAPALDNAPIYQNDREGFRFVMPEGWSQRARTDVPAGTYPKERLLVAYHQSGSESPAWLEATLADLPEATDLAVFLAEPSYGVTEWRLKAGPESIEVTGAAGRRWTFTGREGKNEWIKEVVAVRRGGRTYFFNLLFAPTDTTSRDQGRRAIASLIWK